jgi:tRNA threonylcarbamoyladenosine biosynthesis protein TsaE
VQSIFNSHLKITYQIQDLNKVAASILEQATSKTILFKGEMGTGKTTLIKALVKALGSSDVVSSPTFSIVNEYLTPGARIFHFDMYRIEDEIEALNFGIEDYLDSSAWIFMEWPEKISNILPENVNLITITLENKTSRTLKLSQNINLTKIKAIEQ